MSAPAARVSVGTSTGRLLIIGGRQCAADNGDGQLETTNPERRSLVARPVKAGVGPSSVGGRERNFTGEVFWARGYFISTVGLDEEMIRAYIRNQEKEDGRYDQMRLKLQPAAKGGSRGHGAFEALTQ
jgi:hypothetical protein